MKINDTCIGVFGGIQPEILSQFAKGKIQSGFVDRWLFAFLEKVRYLKFNDASSLKKCARHENNEQFGNTFSTPGALPGRSRILEFTLLLHYGNF